MKMFATIETAAAEGRKKDGANLVALLPPESDPSNASNRL